MTNPNGPDPADEKAGGPNLPSAAENGFRPMPPSAESEASRPKPPTQVLIAFWILVAAGVLQVLGGLLSLGQREAVVTYLRQHPQPTIKPSQYESIATQSIVVAVASGIVFGLIYFGLAMANRGGRNWARITLTVVTVVGGLYNLYYSPSIFSLVGLVILVATLVLLYLPASAEYFLTMKRLRQS